MIATHVKFLHKMRDRCLLHERAAVVADTIRKILDLALHFQVQPQNAQTRSPIHNPPRTSTNPEINPQLWPRTHSLLSSDPASLGR